MVSQLLDAVQIVDSHEYWSCNDESIALMHTNRGLIGTFVRLHNVEVCAPLARDRPVGYGPLFE